MRREFVQLAHTWRPEEHGIGGWFMSEKLDGMRAYWDGGISRGIPSHAVGWANTLKDKDVKISTGLWSRYGKIIFAPDTFLDQLPTYPLDGELYLGPGNFQELMSTVKRHEPDIRWASVYYMVFDSPSDAQMFSDGELTHHMFKAVFNGIIPKRNWSLQSFRHTVKFLQDDEHSWGPQIKLAKQQQLSLLPHKALERVDEAMDKIIVNGGEGLMLRRPVSVWMPQRSWDLLKVKRFMDGEGVVIGYTWGKGKLDGMMGSCVLEWHNKHLEISGFTEHERELYPIDRESKRSEPGSYATGYQNPKFTLGSKVTFKYQKLSDTGIPVHANYLRRYNG